MVQHRLSAWAALLTLILCACPTAPAQEPPPEFWFNRDRAAAAAAAEVFARSAAENAHVNWADMFREPWKFRGQVIPVSGKLKRLRRLDAPLPLQKEWIKVVYEGWVFTPTYGSNPVCVIFPDLPQ